MGSVYWVAVGSYSTGPWVAHRLPTGIEVSSMGHSRIIHGSPIRFVVLSTSLIAHWLPVGHSLVCRLPAHG